MYPHIPMCLCVDNQYSIILKSLHFTPTLILLFVVPISFGAVFLRQNCSLAWHFLQYPGAILPLSLFQVTDISERFSHCLDLALIPFKVMVSEDHQENEKKMKTHEKPAIIINRGNHSVIIITLSQESAKSFFV